MGDLASAVNDLSESGEPIPLDVFRQDLVELADKAGEWSGIPMLVPGLRLKMEDRYPFKEIEALIPRDQADQAIESFESVLDGSVTIDAWRTGDGDSEKLVVKAPNGTDLLELEKGKDTDLYNQLLERVDEIARYLSIRNKWYSRRRNAWITLYLDDVGKVQMEVDYLAAQYINRLDYWVSTAEASTAWDLKAEFTALEKLQSLLSDSAFGMYVLTGTFVEISKRSRVMYLFRKNRPTIAMVPSDHDDTNSKIRVLTALCLHPLGYYEKSWSGCMVPTDDVISHLLLMRGDEHGFWRRANQHDPASAEAGI